MVLSLMEIVTMRPPPCSSISGTIARAVRKHPVAFVSSTSRKPFGDTSQKGWGSDRKRGLTVRIPMPALLTSRSMPPRRSHTSSTPAATARSSRTSRARPRTAGPRPAAADAARSASRLVIATRAPASTRAFAIARPRPLVAPVTRSEEHTSELQSHLNLVCRLLLEKKKKQQNYHNNQKKKKKKKNKKK